MASPGRGSGGMTKEQLKAALIQHGVAVPPVSAKKDEFQRLYDVFVRPIVARSADFSSDEEGDVLTVNTTLGPVDILFGQASMNAIKGLSDEELYIACVEAFGRDRVGPVLENTRVVYQNKLFNYFDNPESTNGSPRRSNGSPSGSNGSTNSSAPTLAAADAETNGANGFSDSDDDTETASKASRSSRASGSGAVNGTPTRGNRRSGANAKKQSRRSVQEVEVDDGIPQMVEANQNLRAPYNIRRSVTPREIVPTATVQPQLTLRPRLSNVATGPERVRNITQIGSESRVGNEYSDGHDFAHFNQPSNTLRNKSVSGSPKIEEIEVPREVSRLIPLCGILLLLIAAGLAYFFQDTDSFTSLVYNRPDAAGEVDELDRYLESIKEGNNI